MLPYTATRFAALAAFMCLTLVERVDGQDQPCNPIKSTSCPPTPGLDKSDYFIDFTNPPSDLSKSWTTSNYATVTYNTKGKNGAEFTIAKRYDAPQLFTNFHILFGRVDIVMQIASGIGIISSGVLLSPDGDEIDWEFSGNNFGTKNPQYIDGAAQNNYFGKGVTGIYDRGGWAASANPKTQFHTYSFDWSPTKLDWILDGTVVRTLLASDANNNDHQYPQTPSKIQVGIWDGGDPDLNPGTIGWAGGTTDMSGAPFTMFVKSVRIKNYYPAQSYSWTDQSGSWKSIRPLNDSIPDAAADKVSSSASSIKAPVPPSSSLLTRTSVLSATNTNSLSTPTTHTQDYAPPPSMTTSVLPSPPGKPAASAPIKEASGTSPGGATKTPTRGAPLGWIYPLAVSHKGACSQRGWQTCKGSAFGNCCSRQGYCGGGSEHCGDGCQAHWGLCGMQNGGGGQQQDHAKAAATPSTSARCAKETSRGRTARDAHQWWARDAERMYPPGPRPNATDMLG